MTAQTPERIIIDGRPRALYEQPLYRLLEKRRMTLCDPKDERFGMTTACWRRYVGTWEIRDGILFLIHLNLNVPHEEPLPQDIRQRFLRCVPAADFPIRADWFSGRLRIATGPRLVYSHHGWSSWYARERVITIKKGVVKRDRDVDTQAILEWWLRRHPELSDRLSGRAPAAFGPIVWFEKNDEDWTADWWPPDYRKEDHLCNT